MIQDEKNLDSHIATYLDKHAQTLSRRGLLANAGKWILRFSGLALIPLLPLDRRFSVEAQSGGCGWATCGMNGVFCKPCCGSSNVTNACPGCSGMVTGGAWGATCYCPANRKRASVLYYDCCTDVGRDADGCRSSLWCRAGLGTANHGETYCPQNPRTRRKMGYSCTVLNINFF